MNQMRDAFKQKLSSLLEQHFPDSGILLFDSAVILWIASCAVAIHVFLRFFLRHFIERFIDKQDHSWRSKLLSHKLFERASFLLQGIIVHIQAGLWFDESSALLKLLEMVSAQWIILFLLLSFFSLLDIFQSLADNRANRSNFPLKGLFQTVKLMASILMVLLAIALLMGKSPLILLSGLGALSAILLLVFKDPILGLVAGIQLSANNMLAIGDWIEMPKYGADGDVLEIALTTVKVRNWDKTITTIPTYALISDSFKNWQGMSDSGGRRIKRSITIAADSIHFLDENTLTTLYKTDLLGSYLKDRLKTIEEENTSKATDMSVLMNGRRLTNIGTFRQYLVTFLKDHPGIHQDMTLLVRQLAPSANGLPIEIYAFTNTTSWREYEDIQSDIFDHIFAVLPEFKLRAHEAPTGHDVRFLMAKNESQS